MPRENANICPAVQILPRFLGTSISSHDKNKFYLHPSLSSLKSSRGGQRSAARIHLPNSKQALNGIHANCLHCNPRPLPSNCTNRCTLLLRSGTILLPTAAESIFCHHYSLARVEILSFLHSFSIDGLFLSAEVQVNVFSAFARVCELLVDRLRLCSSAEPPRFT